MRFRRMPALAILAGAALVSVAAAGEAPAPYSPPARIAAANRAAQQASGTATPSEAPAPPAASAPSPTMPSAPASQPTAPAAKPTPAPGSATGAASADTITRNTSQEEGAAVVQQILKDKEDLIEGKRFTYDPAGRRDPFRSLLEEVSHFKGPRPKGVSGMLIGEIVLQGTVKDKTGNVAFLRGSDNKGYFVHVGDEVYDGRIISIDPESGTVTFRQRVDDPRQIKPYRDIVKRLSNSTEEEAQ